MKNKTLRIMHFNKCSNSRSACAKEWAREREMCVLVHHFAISNWDWSNTAEFDQQANRLIWPYTDLNTHVGRTKRVEAMLWCYHTHTNAPRAFNSLFSGECLYAIQKLLYWNNVCSVHCSTLFTFQLH